jgi:hypothetical protein
MSDIGFRWAREMTIAPATIVGCPAATLALLDKVPTEITVITHISISISISI